MSSSRPLKPKITVDRSRPFGPFSNALKAMKEPAMPTYKKRPKSDSKDVLDSGSRAEGMSTQGEDVRDGEMTMAKDEAKGRSEMERTVKPKMKGLADGGEVDQPSGADDPSTWEYAVQHVFDPKPDATPTPQPSTKPIDAGFFKDGGEVGPEPESNDDDAMDDAMGEELMGAIHSKDKKG